MAGAAAATDRLPTASFLVSRLMTLNDTLPLLCRRRESDHMPAGALPLPDDSGGTAVAVEGYGGGMGGRGLLTRKRLLQLIR